MLSAFLEGIYGNGVVSCTKSNSGGARNRPETVFRGPGQKTVLRFPVGSENWWDKELRVMAESSQFSYAFICTHRSWKVLVYCICHTQVRRARVKVYKNRSSQPNYHQRNQLFHAIYKCSDTAKSCAHKTYEKSC
jgi:hypothetical protein